MDPFKLLQSLVNAKNEDEVKDILIENKIWNCDEYWKDYGGYKNNENTIENQQDNAMAALIEKPINSLDAVLIKECKLKGIDPKSDKAPETMQKAVEQFFNVRNGDFFEEEDSKRKDLSQNVRIIAEGKKKKPNVIIADFGEGQEPEKFPKTFCSLHEGGEKNKIPFVQGRYNMGGSGVLPFCGKHQFQLIISKKCPDIVKNNRWGFTLVRIHPSKSEDEQLWHEYLINPNNGEVFYFEKDNLSILPDGKSMNYGTYIKLFNYSLPPSYRTHFERGFWKEANRILFSPPLPILVQETRYGKLSERMLLGNRTRIRDHKTNESKSKIYESFDIQAKLGFFDTRSIEVTVFKERTHTQGRWGGTEEFTSKEEAIFFTVNGQTHFTLPRSYFSKAKLDFLRDELLIHIDCTSVPRQRKRKVFMPNRTNIRKTEEFRKIEKDLIDVLRSDESLRRINHIREEDSIVHNTRDQDYANKIIQKIAKIVPEISNLLNIGNNFKLGINKNLKNRQERLSNQKEGTTMKEDVFEGERFPSFFEIFKWNPSKGVFKKELPQNSYVWVKFLTDVRDDYFNEIRGAERGFFKCDNPQMLTLNVLHKGTLTARIKAPEQANIGEIIRIRFELTHPYRESLFQDIEFRVVEPQNTEDRKGRTENELEKSIPSPIPVYRQEQVDIAINDYKTWQDMDSEWDENTVSQVKETDTSKNVYINLDSRYLHNFIKRQTNISYRKLEAIKRNYLIAILLYSIIVKSKLNEIEDEITDIDKEVLFNNMMQGVSSIILDLTLDNKRIFEHEED